MEQIPQSFFRLIYLALTLYLGVAAGYFCAGVVGLNLTPETVDVPSPPAISGTAQVQTELADFSVVTERNLFNSKPVTEEAIAATDSETPQETPREPKVNLVLHGTVEAGPDSLALLSGGGETKIFRLGDQLPGKAVLQQVERTRVLVEYADGNEKWLALYQEKKEEAAAPAETTGRRPVDQTTNAVPAGAVKQVGENSFEVDRQVADKARQDINQLMRQMRMEPFMQDGKTAGFLVRWIQPNTFLSQLGLRRGDVVEEINQVRLDSPEKALMIFQQLREARTLSIGINRGGKPQVMKYDIK